MTESQLAVTDKDGALLNRSTPTNWSQSMEQHEAWPILSRLSVLLVVHVHLDKMKVRDLLQLKPQQILTSSWSSTGDVPLAIGEVRLAWSEFEVMGQRIGVRITQLA